MVEARTENKDKIKSIRLTLVNKDKLECAGSRLKTTMGGVSRMPGATYFLVTNFALSLNVCKQMI